MVYWNFAFTFGYKRRRIEFRLAIVQRRQKRNLKKKEKNFMCATHELLIHQVIYHVYLKYQKKEQKNVDN